MGHFVLVHGGCHGAWCWYKTASLLEGEGHKVTLLDLAGCGIHPTNPNTITTFEEYSHPLVDILSSIPDTEKVILVGHSLGGLSVTYVTELFPKKLAVAVYMAAPMLPWGREEIDIMQMSQGYGRKMQFLFGNGEHKPPTAVFFSKDYFKEACYNLSPPEDVSLASVLLRPTPLGVTNSSFKSTEEGYGSVPRVYIKTTEDKILHPSAQEAMIQKSPPNQIFHLVADHSPFFSATLDLHQLLLGIASTYSK